ncbi:MAG: single-stranded-DNA-specific exonuclease RecJ [Bacteroidia bacterium]|nr:MAG: single-stranded-DNA-specific exonuclease RecJ [Bacteroidia bacterium]
MKWLLKELTQEEKECQLKLSNELGIDSVLSRLLVLRGITNFDLAKKFFRPSLEDLHSPFLMHDMDKAVHRLNQAIQNNEKILIYGDYDVDGTTAVSCMFLFLQKIVDKSLLDYYVPDRFKEGYGLSFEGAEYAKTNGFSLIITLDCGIKDNDKIKYAQDAGIDCIVCDHHTPPEILPPAFAILNPKKENCHYPYKELTGCGIGFKLMQAYCEKHGINKDIYWNLVDLVATSIAADIVPIDGENRVLAYYGLKKMNENPVVGLKKLVEIAFSNRNRKLKVSDIVFFIAPRINAAGRLEHGSKAIQLLISSNEEEAEYWAKQLHDVNTQRQDIDKQILEEAIEFIEKDEEFQTKKTTVVFNHKWHKGVVGIVAAKLVERYYRPTIVLTEHDGLITGSARSIEGFDLYEALYKCKEYLYQFGGHKYAAGLSIEKHHLNTFIEQFEKCVRQSITEEIELKKIWVDAVLNLENITPKFLRILKQFEPHGPSNMQPLFWIKNVKDTGRMHEVGNGHLKMYLSQNSHKECPAIFFNGIDYFDKLKGKTFDCLCKIDISDIQNEQIFFNLIIEDIKIN